MLKSDMTCEKCIYSEPFAIGEEVEFKSKIGVNSVICKLHPATKVKGKKSWCVSGCWQRWHENEGPEDVISQWSCYAWGEFEEPTEEEKQEAISQRRQ